MIEIDLENIDIKTKQKYEEFAEKVENLLVNYEKNDAMGVEKVKQRMEQTKGNWDEGITLIDKNANKIVPVSQLLAYEYCLATERITNAQVSFDDILNKLFDGVLKFRIGNPVPGMDDECLYGKGINDQGSIPVTTKQYRIKMGAGAQHLDYIKDEKKASAVFIFAKQKFEKFAIDENGKQLSKITDGINFEKLPEKISLLTELRQTAFHEWNHNAEKENIQPLENPMKYEYDSIDGKRYRNYMRVNQYVSGYNINIQEPQYILGPYINEEGKTVKGYYYIDSDGREKDIVDFGLKREKLEKEFCFSTGLTTYEIESNGKLKIHNQITEGFVEATARAMVLAVDDATQDIDTGKYYEMVEMAKRIITSRDKAFGKDGKTYADFLTHSSTLKLDLESKIVDEKVDRIALYIRLCR